MTRRLALYALIAAVISVAAAYASAFLPGGATNLSAFLMAVGIAMMAVSLMTLGAVREGEKLGSLKWAFAFVFVVFVGGFTAAMILPDTDSAMSRLFLGLPARAAIIVYGIGFLPVLVLPFVYASNFEQRTLKPEDIESIKKLAAENASQTDGKRQA
jgi:ABC-type uncharacterized transport system permease subunit